MSKMKGKVFINGMSEKNERKRKWRRMWSKRTVWKKKGRKIQHICFVYADYNFNLFDEPMLCTVSNVKMSITNV